MAKTTWRELIAREEAAQKDAVIECALSPEGLDLEFDNAYGPSEGVPFTAWSKQRVYFPVVYDGAEWVASAPRNPCSEATHHVGGQ